MVLNFLTTVKHYKLPYCTLSAGVPIKFLHVHFPFAFLLQYFKRLWLLANRCFLQQHINSLKIEIQHFGINCKLKGSSGARHRIGDVSDELLLFRTYLSTFHCTVVPCCLFTSMLFLKSQKHNVLVLTSTTLLNHHMIYWRNNGGIPTSWVPSDSWWWIPLAEFAPCTWETVTNNRYKSNQTNILWLHKHGHCTSLIFSIFTSTWPSELIAQCLHGCLTLNDFHASCHDTFSVLFYQAFIWMPAHSLDQLVDLLVVFQGVPQGILGAEQPLAQAVYLRVQSWGVQHRVPPVVRWCSFSALKHTNERRAAVKSFILSSSGCLNNIWKNKMIIHYS